MTPNNKRLSRLKKKNRKRNLAHSPPPSNTCIDDDHSRTSSSNSRSNSNSRSIAKANTALHHQNVEANIKVTDPNYTNGRRSPSSGGYGGGNSGSNSGENNKINSLFEFAATKKKKTTHTNNVNTNVNQGNTTKNDDNDEDDEDDTGINNNNNNININNNKKNENDNTCDIDDTKSGRDTDINTDDEVILVKTMNDNDNNNDDNHSLRFNNHTGSKKNIFTIHERQYDEEGKVVSTAPAKKHENATGNANASTSMEMEMEMGVEIATKTRMCTVQNSTKSKSKNYFCSPFEILQLDTDPNTRICTSINDDTKCDSTNDGSSRQKKKLKYYDQSYYAALVESYIQNEFEDNDNKDDNDNDNHERINKGYIRNCVTDTHTTNDNSNNCSFYDHPILGKIHFEQPKNNKHRGDIHKTTSMNNPLSFPKIDNTNVNTNNQGCTHRTRYNGKGRNWCIVGASIHLDLLSFPKKSYDDNYLNNHKHNHDLPIPMKTSGMLKIICYQGATVRNKYEIDDEDVELFRLSKDDIREFVDVKWLPPPPLSQHGSNTIQDSSSSEEEESNLSGIFRYKIRLGRNDTTKPKNKKSSNYEEEFGWISDKSRLVDNPYWIALVL